MPVPTATVGVIYGRTIVQLSYKQHVSHTCNQYDDYPDVIDLSSLDTQNTLNQ